MASSLAHYAFRVLPCVGVYRPACTLGGGGGSTGAVMLGVLYGGANCWKVDGV